MSEEYYESNGKCDECGSQKFIRARNSVVCVSCGLEQESKIFDMPRTNDSEDGKRRATSSIVKNNKFSTLLLNKSGDAASWHLARTHKRETSKYLKIKFANNMNKSLLAQIICELGVDDRVAAKAVEILDKVINDHEKGGVGWESRRTVKKRNVVFLDALLATVDEDLNVKLNNKDYINHATRNSELKHVAHVFSRFKVMLKSVYKLGVAIEMRAREVLSRYKILRFSPKILKLLNFISFNSIDAAVIACARYVYAYYQIPFNVKCSTRYISMIGMATGFALVEPSSDLTDETFHVAKPGIIIRHNNVAFNTVFNDEFDDILSKTIAFAENIGEEKFNDLITLVPSTIDERIVEIKSDVDTLDIARKSPFFIKKNGRLTPVFAIRDIIEEVKKLFSSKTRDEVVELPLVIDDDHKKMRVEAGPRRASIGHDQQSVKFTTTIDKKRSRKTDNHNNAPENTFYHWIRIKKVKEALKLIFSTSNASPSKIFEKLPAPGTRGIWRDDVIPKYVIYDLFLFLREYGFAEKSGAKGEPIRITSTIAQVTKFIDSL